MLLKPLKGLGRFHSSRWTPEMHHLPIGSSARWCPADSRPRRCQPPNRALLKHNLVRELKQLRRENAQLRRANEILKAALVLNTLNNKREPQAVAESWEPTQNRDPSKPGRLKELSRRRLLHRSTRTERDDAERLHEPLVGVIVRVVGPAYKEHSDRTSRGTEPARCTSPPAAPMIPTCPVPARPVLTLAAPARRAAGPRTSASPTHTAAPSAAARGTARSAGSVIVQGSSTAPRPTVASVTPAANSSHDTRSKPSRSVRTTSAKPKHDPSPTPTPPSSRYSSCAGSYDSSPRPAGSCSTRSPAAAPPASPRCSRAHGSSGSSAKTSTCRSRGHGSGIGLASAPRPNGSAKGGGGGGQDRDE
jgi:hypothetical protein